MTLYQVVGVFHGLVDGPVFETYSKEIAEDAAVKVVAEVEGVTHARVYADGLPVAKAGEGYFRWLKEVET